MEGHIKRAFSRFALGGCEEFWNHGIVMEASEERHWNDMADFRSIKRLQIRWRIFR